jgi:hypothetical protein
MLVKFGNFEELLVIEIEMRGNEMMCHILCRQMVE